MAFFDDCIIAPDGERDLPEYAAGRATTDYLAFLHPYERFHRYVPCMRIDGAPSPEEVVEAVMKGGMPSTDLTVAKDSDIHDQGKSLRNMLEYQKPDMVSLVRRSWHDFAMTKPVRHWRDEPQDFQIMKREAAADMTDKWQLRRVICRPDYGPFIEDFRAAFQEMKK